jgi:pyrroline-5-carboxylate reductase
LAKADMTNPTTDSTRILLIGCGKMGQALLRGWHSAGLQAITVIEPHDLPDDSRSHAQTYHRALTDLPPPSKPFDAVVIATKPQQVDDVCRALSPFLAPTTLVLSIAAGRTITGMLADLPANQPVIRAMPNTPAAIGRGVTVAVTSPTAQRDLADQLLKATGDVIWIDDENLMDAITALSGSGPAYVFMLMEVLAEAGKHCGLPHDLATRLARQTVIGSAALAESQPSLPASTLRQNVTSPGGTTAAALEILSFNNALQTLFERALESATRRSRELSK